MNNHSYGLLAGRYPAIIDSVDQVQRLCRIRIPGLTDHADCLPLAEIEYPIGEKSRHKQYATEIEILPGDPVWVAFIGGDARYPIITGSRNPQAGNQCHWRRWHHTNIGLLADQQLQLHAPTVTITASTLTINAAQTICSGNLTVEGNLDVTGGTVTHGGKTIGNNHMHGGILSGPGTTTPPL